MLLAILAVALVSRFRTRLTMVEQATFGAVLFLVLTPGFGVQYVVFAAPLLCMVDLPESIWWGCLAGVFIGTEYWFFRARSIPLQSTISEWYPTSVAILGMLAWTVLVHFLWKHARAAWSGGASHHFASVA